MTKFHAVLLDECGDEFGADVEASDKNVAYETLAEDYPESRVIQLESPEDTQQREAAMQQRIQREMDDGW